MAQTLSQLNNKSEPIEFKLIRKSVESELDGALEDLFLDFDEEPLELASPRPTLPSCPRVSASS